ncbi:MAG: hypothetical protein WCI57_02970 [Candidatus Berkelbacteria bacterium]
MINTEQLQNLLTPVTENTPPLEKLISNAANVYLMIAGMLAFLYLVYSGILYITSAGDTEKAKKAQTGFINVIIGVVVISLSYVIVRTVGTFAVQIIK